MDASYAYWTDFANGTIERRSITGADSVSTIVAAGQPEPASVVVDDRAVYWVNKETIMRLAK
jgi:hypothetical protein